jgi:hypothetical protein
MPPCPMDRVVRRNCTLGGVCLNRGVRGPVREKPRARKAPGVFSLTPRRVRLAKANLRLL